MADFLEAADAASDRADSLLGRLAKRQVERATAFMRQLHTGQEISYDGEDRDWLLGLTQETEHSIDAISLSTVDAGMRGLDGGIWTSNLGTRYLELQREAIARSVSIRRIFAFENQDLAQDEIFLKITKAQRDIGVNVRMLDCQLLPDWLQPMIFDFILFDGTVSYETTPVVTFTSGQARTTVGRTLLVPVPARIRDLEETFDELWAAANPEREIDP